MSLFFAFALGSMISLAVSFFIAFLLFSQLLPIKRPIVAMFFIVGILGFLSLFFFSTFKEAKGVAIHKNSPSSMQARFIYWQNAIDNFIERPLFGSGLDTFRVINKESPRKAKLGSFFTHNFFLQMLSDTGIFGFLSGIALIGSILWSVFKKISQPFGSAQGKRPTANGQRLLTIAFWAGLLASTLNSMIDFDWQLPTVFLLYWIFAGLLNTHAKRGDSF